MHRLPFAQLPIVGIGVLHGSGREEPITVGGHLSHRIGPSVNAGILGLGTSRITVANSAGVEATPRIARSGRITIASVLSRDKYAPASPSAATIATFARANSSRNDRGSQSSIVSVASSAKR